MKNQLLVAALFGCLCVYGVNGMLPLLGESVNHPLFFFGPQNLIMLFDMNSTLGQVCLENVGLGVMNSLTGVFKCAAEMASATTDGPPSPASICSSVSSFSACFHEQAMSIADTCELTEKQRKLVADAVENNEEITEYLCEDNAIGMIRYRLNNGMSCAAEKREELLQCLNIENPSEMMTYDAEGCRNAQEFIECAAAEMNDCSSDAGDIVKKVMQTSLQDVCELNMGHGQLPPGRQHDSSEEYDDDDFQEIGSRRRDRSNKHRMMKQQVDLLKEIRDALHNVIGALHRNEVLLQTISEK